MYVFSCETHETIKIGDETRITVLKLENGLLTVRIETEDDVEVCPRKSQQQVFESQAEECESVVHVVQ